MCFVLYFSLVICGLVGSVLGFGAASELAFSLKALFPGSIELTRKSHFNKVLYHAYNSHQWAIGGRIYWIVCHSPVEHWRSECVSANGFLMENVASSGHHTASATFKSVPVGGD